MDRIRYICQLFRGDVCIDFVRQLKSRLIGLCYRIKKRPVQAQECYITCAGKTDGAGAQVQAIFSTMLFAQKFGIVYVHTPFDKIWSDQSSEKWESFFNLGENEVTISEVDQNSLDVVHVNYPIFIGFKSNTLYVVEHCHSFVDSNNNAKFYSDITSRLIEKYHISSKKNYKSFREAGKVNIALHVRRGDVSKTGEHSDRYTDNLYYKSLLDSIKSILDDLKIESSIHLYSQGDVEDFHELKGMGVNYHLDECVLTTFNNLVSSDVIIMSKSTYSYSAALLSKAIVIYEPFWHKPLEDWIVINWDDKGKKVISNMFHLEQKIRAFN